MKSIIFAKIILVFYLCISQQAIECLQVRRHKKILHKAQQVKVHTRRQQQQAKQQLYAQISAMFKTRDENLSIYPDVNAQMIKMWKVIQADGTKLSDVEAEEEVLKKLYDKKSEEFKNDAAKLKKQEAESQFFKKTFDEAKLIDQKYEQAMRDLKAAELEASKNDSTLTQEQKDSQVEINLRKKYSISEQILKGQQGLMRIFTQFLRPKKDAQLFKKNVIKAIENSMPDKFCYKKSSTLAPVQKLSCPTTHPESSLGFCVETCDQGQARNKMMPNSKFEKTLGVCWERCNTSKEPKCVKSGLIVYPTGKSWTNWHWQRSFIPDFKTVFSKDVTCQANEKKWGFLCYQNFQECKNFGYEDCGGSSCSLNKLECAKVIKDMVVQTILGLSKFALMFVAPGASTVIQSVSSVIENVDKFASIITSMLESRDLLVQIYNKNELRQRLIKETVNNLKSNKNDIIDDVQLDDKTLYEKVTEILQEQVEKIQKKKPSLSLLEKADLAQKVTGVAKEAVSAVGAAGAQQVLSNTVTGAKIVVQTKEVGKLLDNLEVFDISLVQDIIDIGKSCTGSGSKVDCAKALLGPIAAFDPTGLAGIARAFLYNTCKDLNDD